MGSKGAGALVAVWARTMGRGQRVVSVSGPAGNGKGSRDVLVAMMSIPVLSRPKKKSRPSVWRGIGIVRLPIGTSPAGIIFRNNGGPGSPAPVTARLTAELSQLLRMAKVAGEFPPASKAKDPV